MSAVDIFHEAAFEKQAERPDRAKGVNRDGVALTVVEYEPAIFVQQESAVLRFPQRRPVHDAFDRKAAFKVGHIVTGALTGENGVLLT